jgi:hypothetical protein
VGVEVRVETFAHVAAVLKDAKWRRTRVALFFEVLFALSLVGLLVLDRLPPGPHYECGVHHAQTQSKYSHPYGEPPEAVWSTCVYVR